MTQLPDVAHILLRMLVVELHRLDPDNPVGAAVLKILLSQYGWSSVPAEPTPTETGSLAA
jgi:hypothetical protein